MIAVIVSGYDGDRAAAVCDTKEVGGITIAQKPDMAKQPEMPESAIAASLIASYETSVGLQAYSV